MPSEQDFANLIDSMVNILEEGFDKSSETGLKISQLMGAGKLLCFYENIAVDSPRWFMELATDGAGLHFGTPVTPKVLSLRNVVERVNGVEVTRVAVGINKELPEAELDVEGTIVSSGRIGREGTLVALADGEWQDITEPLTGCEAFEVVAGVGGQDPEGKYALLHAIALNTFNGASSIKEQHAYYGPKCNRIELRWTPVPQAGEFHYKLQVRTQCSYGKDIAIRYRLTRLWMDQMMFDSLQPG
ncbi:MAG: hypothetical protein ACO1PZ_03545 [Gammaproteobacteria bacterium]